MPIIAIQQANGVGLKWWFKCRKSAKPDRKCINFLSSNSSDKNADGTYNVTNNPLCNFC